MKNTLFSFLILFNLSALSQTPVGIIPKPVEITQKNGYFNLNKSTIIIANSSVKHNADMLNYYLKKFYGFTLSAKNISPYQNTKNVISLGLVYPEGMKRDQYYVSVESNKMMLD